jgi:hypothetical protein
MDVRASLAVYFLVAAVAGFVTAAGTLPFGALLAVLLALGIVAILLRQRLLGLGGMTRVSVAWLGVYVLAYLVTALLFRR